MKKRTRLIWKTLLLCSVPVLVAAGIIFARQRQAQSPYVAGQEQENITRRLDRTLTPGVSDIRFVDVTEHAAGRNPYYTPSTK